MTEPTPLAPTLAWHSAYADDAAAAAGPARIAERSWQRRRLLSYLKEIA
jgi:hypothetical protein